MLRKLKFYNEFSQYKPSKNYCRKLREEKLMFSTGFLIHAKKDEEEKNDNSSNPKRYLCISQHSIKIRTHFLKALPI